jgi:hypothetical protein
MGNASYREAPINRSGSFEPLVKKVRPAWIVGTEPHAERDEMLINEQMDELPIVEISSLSKFLTSL